MDQGPLIHINGGAHSGVPGEVATQTAPGATELVPPGGPCGTPRRGGFDPPDLGGPPGGARQGPSGAPGLGGQISPPG